MQAVPPCRTMGRDTRVQRENKQEAHVQDEQEHVHICAGKMSRCAHERVCVCLFLCICVREPLCVFMCVRTCVDSGSVT